MMLDTVHRNLKKNQLLTQPAIDHIRILIKKEPKGIMVRVFRHTGWPGDKSEKYEIERPMHCSNHKKAQLYAEEMRIVHPDASIIDLVGE